MSDARLTELDRYIATVTRTLLEKAPPRSWIEWSSHRDPTRVRWKLRVYGRDAVHTFAREFIPAFISECAADIDVETALAEIKRLGP